MEENQPNCKIINGEKECIFLSFVIQAFENSRLCYLLWFYINAAFWIGFWCRTISQIGLWESEVIFQYFRGCESLSDLIAIQLIWWVYTFLSSRLIFKLTLSFQNMKDSLSNLALQAILTSMAVVTVCCEMQAGVYCWIQRKQGKSLTHCCQWY